MRDAKLPRSFDESGNRKNGHTLLNVYGVMLRQITRDYGGLPDPRTLTLHQIRFFYDGLREEISQLKRA